MSKIGPRLLKIQLKNIIDNCKNNKAKIFCLAKLKNNYLMNKKT